ncbi:hypothetical protein L7F22_016152 [Adiantum nelumboides]|nr:hypothetical protein [Adiantum nelumboides]
MIAAGAEHTAAVTENGKLYSWGWGRYGNLGLGDRNDRLVPEAVPSIPGEQINLVACGWRHTIAVTDSGALYTCGWSKYGQLGHGDHKDHLVPHQVAVLKANPIVQISGGWRHTMALDDQGKLYGWGWNKFGQVGVGDNVDHNSPQLVRIPAEEQISHVSCGWRHTVAISTKYNVFSWGRGTSGQLGHGDAVDRSLPKMIDSLSADGEACATIESSASLPNAAAANWISPSERYAVVPDETVGSQASRPPDGTREDASVPDSEPKRLRTE